MYARSTSTKDYGQMISRRRVCAQSEQFNHECVPVPAAYLAHLQQSFPLVKTRSDLVSRFFHVLPLLQKAPFLLFYGSLHQRFLQMKRPSVLLREGQGSLPNPIYHP